MLARGPIFARSSHARIAASASGSSGSGSAACSARCYRARLRLIDGAASDQARRYGKSPVLCSFCPLTGGGCYITP